MNVSHAIPDDIKNFQQAEPEHFFNYTNWWLKIHIWRLYFSSWSPKGDLTIFFNFEPCNMDNFPMSVKNQMLPPGFSQLLWSRSWENFIEYYNLNF